MSAKMLEFSSIQDFINYWTGIMNITLSDVRPSKKVDKDDPNSNTCALNGIEFRLWMGSRPTNRKICYQMCSEDSFTCNHPISIAQAKVAFTRWLHDKSGEMLIEGEGENELFRMPKL